MARLGLIPSQLIAQPRITISYLSTLLLDILRETVSYQHSALYLVEEEAQELVLQAARGCRQGRLGERCPLQQSPLGQTIRKGETLTLSQNALEPRGEPFAGLPYLLAMPLATSKGPVGVLVLDSHQAFPVEDTQLIAAAAPHLAALLEVARLYQQAERDSFYDGLTRAYNRRYFQQALEQELARSRRYDLCFSLALLDAADLKGVNDSYGHQMGDQALIRMAALLRENLRASDIVARYGGDEFVIILPQTDREGARTVIGRVMDLMARATVSWGALTIPIPRLDFGLATYPQDGGEADKLFAAADRDLYRGRGRPLISPP